MRGACPPRARRVPPSRASGGVEPAGGATPALVAAFSDAQYLFFHWPYFLNTLLYAAAKGLPVYTWLGGLPKGLRHSVGPVCKASKWRPDGDAVAVAVPRAAPRVALRRPRQERGEAVEARSLDAHLRRRRLHNRAVVEDDLELSPLPLHEDGSALQRARRRSEVRRARHREGRAQLVGLDWDKGLCREESACQHGGSA